MHQTQKDSEATIFEKFNQIDSCLADPSSVLFRFEYITHHQIHLVNLFTLIAIKVSILIK